MSLNAFPTLLKKLKRKKYRDAYVSSQVKHGIAYQIRTIREQRNWSQAGLGNHANKPQNVISRLENPDYGRATIQTLLNLASAFDVGLVVRFVKFNEFIGKTTNFSPESFEVIGFDDELLEEQVAQEFELGNISILDSALTAKGQYIPLDPYFPTGKDDQQGAEKFFPKPIKQGEQTLTRLIEGSVAGVLQ